MQVWTGATAFLLIAVSCCSAMRSIQPPLDQCTSAPPPDINVAETLQRLSMERAQRHLEVTLPDSFPTSASISCSSGPILVEHTQPNTLYIPDIKRGTCQNLQCAPDSPTCYVRSSSVAIACVHVIKFVNDVPEYHGKQIIAFSNHTSCGCKECTDITSAAECRDTDPCPEGKIRDAFCYWTPTLTTAAPNFESQQGAGPSVSPGLSVVTHGPADSGRCRCCTPRRCEPNQVFDRNQCRCKCAVSCGNGQVIVDEDTCACGCPEGSKMTLSGECVGNCENIIQEHCEGVKCGNNSHLNCIKHGSSCRCPSCGDVQDTRECTLTRCLEQQKSKPMCKINMCGDTPRCQCPRCFEQPTRNLCVNTFCGGQQCRWDRDYKSCSCAGGK